MYKYIKAHEQFMKSAIVSSACDLGELKKYHLIQIGFLQHERLIHLLVTLFFGIALFISYALTLFRPSVLLFALDIIVTVLELFYIVHYYRLENAVQGWYEIYNNM